MNVKVCGIRPRWQGWLDIARFLLLFVYHKFFTIYHGLAGITSDQAI